MHISYGENTTDLTALPNLGSGFYVFYSDLKMRLLALSTTEVSREAR